VELEAIQDLVRQRKLRITAHAFSEASKDGVRARDIVQALLQGKLVEHYPDRKRMLISGQMITANLPLHVVCDYSDANEIVVVTVYIPDRSEWTADQIRKR